MDDDGVELRSAGREPAGGEEGDEGPPGEGRDEVRSAADEVAVERHGRRVQPHGAPHGPQVHPSAVGHRNRRTASAAGADDKELAGSLAGATACGRHHQATKPRSAVAI